MRKSDFFKILKLTLLALVFYIYIHYRSSILIFIRLI